MASRALVIGLDGAPPELVFERWRDELPTLRGLMERGTYGVLRSCDPPITVPAWASMTSSRSPGTLGLYGFRNRCDHSYDELVLADSRSVRVPRLWDLLSARRRPVIILGVPQTYPVSRVNGAMVACFQTPDIRRNEYTNPLELKAEIAELVGEYMLDVPDFRADDKECVCAGIEEMTRRRFRVAEHLLETRPWDLFFMVEIGSDRIQHAFWRSEEVVRAYYRALDEKIERLLRFADDDTAILIVSDHGAKQLDGTICVNEWLRNEGYLTLTAEPPEPTRLTPDLVAWKRTLAWAEGGYYARVFFNVAGREPRGALPPTEYESLRDEVGAKLEALGDEQGRPLATRALKPENLYPEVNGVAPDLLVYFGDLSRRSNGRVGTGAIHVRQNDTGPDDANHAHEGLYILAAEGLASGRGPERRLADVAPTLLSLLGEPIPDEMEGSPLWSG